MAKDKSTKKAAVKPQAPSKSVDAVKAGRVTKPAEAAKAKSKETAKSAAKNVDKKSKKAKKEPTPEPSSESESDSDEEMTSASSESSASESEAEIQPDPKTKTNGAAKAAKANDSSSEDGSDSESDEEVALTKAAPKVNGVSKAALDADSDDSSDESEDEKTDTPAGKAAAKADASDDSDDASADSDEDSEEGSDESEEEKVVEDKSSKKRKAEAEAEPAAKKTKTAAAAAPTANGELSAPSKNLFLGGLSWNVDEEWLRSEFEAFSGLVSARVITHADSGKSKGFAYVEFESVEAATAALEGKQGAELDGRELKIDFSQPRPDKGFNKDQVNARAQKYGDQPPKDPSSTLFIGNISFDADQDTVTESFQDYGTINAVRLPTDRDTGAPKGFGYIEFSSIEEATSALEAMNGADIAGRAIRLDYAGQRDNNASPRGGRGGFGDRGGRGGFGDRGGRGRGGFGGRGGGRGGFGDRGGRGGGRGRGGFGDRGGRGGSTNRGGFGDFSGKKTTF